MRGYLVVGGDWRREGGFGVVNFVFILVILRYCRFGSREEVCKIIKF